MRSEQENVMDRRGFLIASAIAAASIPFALAGETKTSLQRLEEILDLTIEVQDWKPVDVTDKVREALGGRQWKFQAINGQYPHDKWTVQSSFEDGDNKIYLPREYGTSFLCQPQRIYTLDLGDEMDGRRVRLPSHNVFSGNTKIAENGVVIYGISRRDASVEKVIMANIRTGKKIIFSGYDQKTNGDRYPDFKLSGNGT